MAEGVCFSTTADGRIIYANRRFEAMFGYEPGEMVGLHVSAANAPGDRSPDDVAREIISALIAGGRWSGEIENVTKSGAPFWSSVSISTFEHPDRGTVWISIHQDITARKRAQVERERLFEELHKALATVKTLSGMLPICSWCKKIRDDQGQWQHIEQYLRERPEANFTHGVCPECAANFFPENVPRDHSAT